MDKSTGKSKKNVPTTDELLKRLNSAKTVSDLEKFAKENEKFPLETTFAEYMEIHRAASGISVAQLIEHAGIQRNYGYQILNGTRNPGRNKVIALCLSLKMSLEDTQRALTLAKEGILYAKNIRDSILIFCINKKMSVMESNYLLESKKQEIL